VHEWFRQDLQLTTDFEVHEATRVKRPEKLFQTPVTKGFKVNDINRWALKE